MEIKTNDIDRIAIRDYIVGMFWALGSLVGAYVSIFFEELPFSLLISHSGGMGKGQIVLAFTFIISFIFAIGYLLQTAHYQKYLGR